MSEIGPSAIFVSRLWIFDLHKSTCKYLQTIETISITPSQRLHKISHSSLFFESTEGNYLKFLKISLQRFAI